MGKIAITTAKYLIESKFEAQGTVEKPDIVGAIFGQTEGLLGDDLELRELQRTGRIGRIEVNVQTRNGKSLGTIEIPSSLSKEETALIAASLETIDRVGPCEARLSIVKLSDVRTSKRKFILDRAKQILRGMMDASETDSLEISELVKEEVRVAEVVAYGPEKLPAGPTIDQSDAVIIVEGRADVINLLRNGIKNVISIEGTSVPPTVAKLTKEKTVTAYVDGDRGGDLILKELFAVGEIDFVARAPDGKEVEELTKKELLKGLRSKVASEQVKLDFSRQQTRRYPQRPAGTQRPETFQKQRSFQKPEHRSPEPRRSPPPERFPAKREMPQEFDKYKEILSKMSETNEAKLIGENMAEIGSVPARELSKVLTDLAMDVHAIVMDSAVTQDIVDAAAGKKVKMLIGTRRAYSKQPASMKIMTMPRR